MKQLRDLLGYLLGLVLFVGLMPTLMWLASGRPEFWSEVAGTDGPYRLNRNPMLTGTLIYLAGFAVWLWSWQALIVWILFFAIMFVQVLSEERRLHHDFGNEYDAYCRHTRRF